MTEVTSATKRLADKSLDASCSSSVVDQPNCNVSENSIITRSTLDALKLVETGSDHFQSNINTHLDSIRTYSSATSAALNHIT